jgi:site-specific DNA recombinase
VVEVRQDAAGLCTPADAPERIAAVAEGDQLRARLDHAADQYLDGLLAARQWECITANLGPRLAAAQARSRVVDRAALLDAMIGVEDRAGRRGPAALSRRPAIIDTLATLILYRTRQDARTVDPEP